MPGLPDLILKAPVFARLEVLSRDTALWKTQAARDALNQIVLDLDDPTKKLIDIAKAGWLYDNDSTVHFEKHWLNSTNDGYWKKMQTEIEAVIRAGMRRACELFISCNYAKPFEYFWVISGDTQSSRWEMSISEGVNQVTVMFHTPQTPPTYQHTIANPKITIARWDNAAGKAVLEPVQVPVP
jgi:hypothetical protein